MAMSENAKAARAAYMREYYKKNRELIRKNRELYWERKAAKMKTEESQTEETEEHD